VLFVIAYNQLVECLVSMLAIDLLGDRVEVIPKERDTLGQKEQNSSPTMTEPKKDMEKMMENIFGNSDDEEELEPVNDVFSSDDELDLPSFKKREATEDDYQPAKRAQKKEKPKRKREQREPSVEVPLSPEAEKKRQAQKDIDDILAKMKPQRQKRDLQSEVEMDEVISALCNQMREAAFQDQEFNKQEQPAIAKLKLLPSVMIHLNKPHWHAQLLDQNVLECVKFWLEPLSDGSLPSLDIQKQLLTIVKQMPVETHQYCLLISLRSSLIGRVLMFYTKCERVQPDIKRIADVLIRRWMRPILGKSADHRHLELKQVRYDPKSARRSMGASQAKEVAERPNRALIPNKVAPAYNVAPASQYGNIQMERGELKKNDKFKKLKTVMKMMGRK
jgi:transcription factor SPN1